MSALQFIDRAFVRVPPRDLWRFLYDTDRLNRSLRLPTVEFVPHANRRLKGHYLARARLGPIMLRYEEFPFEWVEERYYRVVRRFPSGPFREIAGGIRMSPSGVGTDLEIFSDVVPRNRMGAVLARTIIPKIGLGGVLRQVRAFEEGYLKRESFESGAPAPGLSRTQFESRLAALGEAPVDAALIPRLSRLLSHGSDIQVARMRPFDLADQWNADRYDVLRLLLHASRAGLVDLVWEILCPHCRAPSDTGRSLASVPVKSVCETCEVTFRVDLANSVEAVFVSNPGVRFARREMFCIGGPANTPRIQAQVRLEPGERRTERVRLPAGLLSVRSYQSRGRAPVEATQSGAAAIEVIAGRELRVEPGAVACGDVSVGFRNDLDMESLIVLERENWRETAATAAIVTTIQEFRDLFPAEAVAPGQEIAMGRLAVLFTDLSGSTDLYQRVGDVTAFNFVQSHFQYLIRLVAKHRGGVVKTMGDAIMAVFNNGLDALTAAAAMQDDWQDFMSRHSLPAEIRLKVGVHEGPAVAFNNKGAQDYFGTTVNMAARIQARAEGGEIVISESLWRDPDARIFAEARFPGAQPFEADLKGITEKQRLVRLTTGKKGAL